MQPSFQELLLHAIDKYCSSMHSDWEHLHTYYNTFDKHNLQEGIQRHFQLHSLNIQSFDTSSLLIYTEQANKAPTTLLLAISYDSPAQLLLPLLACFATIDSYQTTNGSLPLNLKWLLHANSNSDYSRFEQLVNENSILLQADYCLWYSQGPAIQKLDRTPLLALGNKGYLSISLTAQTSTTPLPSIYGGITNNAAWRLLWALSTLKDSREDILIEGFYDPLTSLDDEPIDQLHTFKTISPALWQMQQWLMGLQDFQLLYTHFLTPTCSITAINSHNSSVSSAASLPSLIPTHATAHVDFFLIPGQDPATIFKKVLLHLQSAGFPDLQVQLLSSTPPSYTSWHHPFVQQILHATSLAYGETPFILPLLPNTLPLAPLQQLLSLPIVIITLPATNSLDPALVTTYARQLGLLIATLSNK